MKKTLYTIAKKTAMCALFIGAAQYLTACGGGTFVQTDPFTGRAVSATKLYDGIDGRYDNSKTDGPTASQSSEKTKKKFSSGAKMVEAEEINYTNTIEDKRYSTEVSPPVTSTDPLVVRVTDKQEILLINGQEMVADWTVKQYPNKTATIETTMMMGGAPRDVVANFSLGSKYEPHFAGAEVYDTEGRNAGRINIALTDNLNMQGKKGQELADQKATGHLPANYKWPTSEIGVLMQRMEQAMTHANMLHAKNSARHVEGIQSTMRVDDYTMVGGTQSKTHDSRIKIVELGRGQGGGQLTTISTEFFNQTIPGGFTQELSFPNNGTISFDRMSTNMMNVAMSQKSAPLTNSLSYDDLKPVFEKTVAIALLDNDIANYPENENSPTITGAFRIGNGQVIVAPEHVIDFYEVGAVMGPNGKVQTIQVGDMTREELRSHLTHKLRQDTYRLGIKNTKSNNAGPSSHTTTSGRTQRTTSSSSRGLTDEQISEVRMLPPSANPAQDAKAMRYLKPAPAKGMIPQ